MKKALLLVSILVLSVISTACINNFAVQELNNKAKMYMDRGDYESAIARLKSSIDLDDTIFETHYNLAVAYTQAEDYANAMNSYVKAIEIDPEIADSYYSLGITESNLIIHLKNGSVRIDEQGNLYTPENDKYDTEEEYKITDEVMAKIDELKADAVKNFQTYLEKEPNAPEANEVQNKIEELQGEADSGKARIAED